MGLFIAAFTQVVKGNLYKVKGILLVDSCYCIVTGMSIGRFTLTCALMTTFWISMTIEWMILAKQAHTVLKTSLGVQKNYDWVFKLNRNILFK